MRSCFIKVGSKPNEWVYEGTTREVLEKDIHREEGYVMTEAQIGMIQLQAQNTKDCWQEEWSCQQLDFGLLASRTMKESIPCFKASSLWQFVTTILGN